MAKTNNIKKVVNGEIADADDVNQIVENAGAEGGLIPYSDDDQNRVTDGSESLGATAYPWGGLHVNREASLEEVDPSSNTVASSIAFSALRKFISQKDTPSSYSGKVGQVPSVNSAENALEFINVAGIPQNVQVFTSNGTWTRPAGVDEVFVKIWGAGGAGGAGSDGNYAGAGGGGGGYAEGLIAVSGNVTVTVGTGTSSFAGDITIQATAGGVGASASGGAGGAGGVGSNGTANLTGGGGANSGGFSPKRAGGGGGSPLGGAGGPAGVTDGASAIAGEAGTIPGGGGGGGNFKGGAAGAGAGGLVIVYY